MAQTLTPDDLDVLAERIPPLVDVDAHVVEPADVWSSRLPTKYRDIGPQIEYHPAGRPVLAGGTYIEEPGTDGPDVAWWFYEDHRYSVKRLIAAAGYAADDISMAGITFDEMKEVILQATIYLGMPKALFAMRKLKAVMAEGEGGGSGAKT